MYRWEKTHDRPNAQEIAEARIEPNGDGRFVVTTPQDGVHGWFLTTNGDWLEIIRAYSASNELLTFSCEGLAGRALDAARKNAGVSARPEKATCSCVFLSPVDWFDALGWGMYQPLTPTYLKMWVYLVNCGRCDHGVPTTASKLSPAESADAERANADLHLTPEAVAVLLGEGRKLMQELAAQDQKMHDIPPEIMHARLQLGGKGSS